MTTLAMLIVALALDGVIGDPPGLWRRIPHPVVLMGRLVGKLENLLNRGTGRRARGALALGLMLVVAAGLGAGIAALPDGGVIEVALAAILLAQNALMRHVGDVARALRSGPEPARAAVARIVGRDTSALDETGIARAAIESAGENFSDGVVAPAFWFALFGLPGIMAYKMLNTADSMIGYRNERYGEFGWATARLDDLANWIPARLSGLLIAASGLSLRALGVMRRDAPKHRSPNAGWPEAALAATLGVAIAGPRSYEGRAVDEPLVNAGGRKQAGAKDIERALTLLWRAWALLLAGLILIWLIRQGSG